MARLSCTCGYVFVLTARSDEGGHAFLRTSDWMENTAALADDIVKTQVDDTPGHLRVFIDALKENPSTELEGALAGFVRDELRAEIRRRLDLALAPTGTFYVCPACERLIVFWQRHAGVSYKREP